MLDGNGPKDELETGGKTPEMEVASGDKNPDAANQDGLGPQADTREEEEAKAPKRPSPEEFENLIKKLKEIHSKASPTVLKVYWTMGTAINEVYKEKPSKEDVQIIAEKVSIEKGYIYKIRQFANSYKKNDLNELTKGNGKYRLPWRAVAQNLSVLPKKLTKLYQETDSLDAFYNSVKQEKPPRKPRSTKTKKSGNLRLAHAEEIQALKDKIAQLEAKAEAKEREFQGQEEALRKFINEVLEIVNDLEDLQKDKKDRIIELIEKEAHELTSWVDHLAEEEEEDQSYGDHLSGPKEREDTNLTSEANA